jgi:acylphosphatase
VDPAHDQHGDDQQGDDQHGEARLTAFVRGRVQGVGYRWWVRSRALELGLVGHASNLDDGRVEVVAEGPRAACERLLALLAQGPASAQVVAVNERWSARRGTESGFTER